MLRLTDLALARGVRVLYRNVSLIAPPGERIGLVGANGSGKSSLFAAILDELAPEAGSLEAPKPERIAHVAQDIEAADESALDYVLAGHAPLMAARAELQAALAGHDDLALAHAHAVLAELNEGAIVARAKAVITTATWHVADGTIRRYAGNYSAFESAWIEQQRQQEAAAKAYERTAAHLQSFVDRFRAKATKARQAQSRIKMLERLQAVEPVRARREWRFEFLEPRKLPERLIDAEDLRLAYPAGDGERTILDDMEFLVRSGDRIGILGVNGAGKSTLVKAIAGELPPAAGELRRGAGLAIGYFAQHQLDQLRPDESPLQQLRRLAPEAREQELREFLGTYRFSGEMATSPVGPMSGGEKARCALALLAWQRPNLLVLDEPTNHLDVETREALTVALSSFEGALLLVSHDRHLLRATVDQLWLVHDGRLAAFEGDLDDYAALVLASRRERSESAAEDPGPSRRELRKHEAQERQRLAAARKPLQAKLAKLEGEVARVSDALRELDARLADPDFYHSGQPDEVAATLKRRGELAQQLETLESRWLELTTEIESIA